MYNWCTTAYNWNETLVQLRGKQKTVLEITETVRSKTNRDAVFRVEVERVKSATNCLYNWHVQLALYNWSCTTGPVQQVLYNWSCTTGPVQLALYNSYWVGKQCIRTNLARLETAIARLAARLIFWCTLQTVGTIMYNWLCTTGSVQLVLYNWPCTTGPD